MSTAIQRRRGTTVEHSTFTGLLGEITVDTTKDTVVVHDGATAGGFPLAKAGANADITGLSAIAAGTAALPSITPTGDTNTGVWFPAADTVAVSTGGSERMRIDTSGNISTAGSNVVGGKTFLNQNADAGAGSYVGNFLTSNNGSINTQMASTAAGGTGSIYYSGTNVFNVYTSGATSLQLGTNNNTGHLVIDSTGNVTKNTATGGLGYGTGAGGTVTQATSKSTAVTLNKPTGTITMNNAALAASTTVGFTFSNSVIGSTDTLVLSGASGAANWGNYNWWVVISSGAAAIYVRNISGGSLSEALVFNFAIIKGATS